MCWLHTYLYDISCLIGTSSQSYYYITWDTFSVVSLISQDLLYGRGSKHISIFQHWSNHVLIHGIDGVFSKMKVTDEESLLTRTRRHPLQGNPFYSFFSLLLLYPDYLIIYSHIILSIIGQINQFLSSELRWPPFYSITFLLINGWPI